MTSSANGSRWLHTTRLPHLLPPDAYFSQASHDREMAQLFLPGWHCVGSIDDLPHDGDFITVELLDKPLIVRNHAGEPRAFVNVCAHRHSLLTRAPSGSAVRLKCQYHGWEYDADGAVCKIPDAACFAPLRRGQERLVRLRVEMLGKLVFVSLAGEGPTARTWLGARASETLERLFSAPARRAVALSLDHPCNWKIPIENVLESYHVPSLHDNFVARHPEVFRLFRGDAGPSREVHELGDGFSVVRDALGADSALYRRLVAAFRPDAKLDFEHLHAFPHVLVGETAVVRFLQVTTPVTPTTSRSLVRIFVDFGQADRGPVERLLAPVVDRAAKVLFDALMAEDAPVFPDVQRGMEASSQQGVLASREERIHHFHAFIAART